MTLFQLRSPLNVRHVRGGNPALLNGNSILLRNAITPAVRFSGESETVAKWPVDAKNVLGSLFRGCASSEQEKDKEVFHG